jgi:hypothetical protein
MCLQVPRIGEHMSDSHGHDYMVSCASRKKADEAG